MRIDRVQCISPGGLHHMHYTEWGDPDNPRVLVCVHGLTRSGRDFDDLARAAAADYRVVCPDVAGRGQSDWLRDKRCYAPRQYAADMVTLIARLGVERVRWVGTSMGGVIGMILASLEGSPIARLVLNDVGPVITAASLRRLGEYVGRAPRVDTIEEAQAYVRSVSAPFGPLSDAQWRHLTEHVVRRAEDGKIEFRYDPDIALAFREAPPDKDMELWPFYDAIRCPTLLLRGAESDLLLKETAEQMVSRGPHAEVVEIAGVGHAPALMDELQIGVVRRFLAGA